MQVLVAERLKVVPRAGVEPENPDDPVWTVIRKLSAKIGEQLTTHLRAIAKENPFAGISLSPLHNCPFSLEIAFATRRHIACRASLRRRLLCLKSRPWCAPREARFETHAHHRHALRWARRTSGASRKRLPNQRGVRYGCECWLRVFLCPT